MSASDELRRMLDERGVKWEKGASLTSMYTYWTDCNDHDVTAVGTDSVMFMSHFVTPTQAIAATLVQDEPIVKCRCCRYFNTQPRHANDYDMFWCAKWRDYGAKPDGFCAWGEKL